MTRKTKQAWTSMHYRCYNPKAPSYRSYGARGINVCKRWHKFENFLSDMGEAPPGLTLERINNNRSYSPKNCKWATPAEQATNTSVSCKAPDGELWKHKAARNGITPQCLWQRVRKYGWTWEKASSIPPNTRDGSVRQSVEKSGVSRTAYYRRRKQNHKD